MGGDSIFPGRHTMGISFKMILYLLTEGMTPLDRLLFLPGGVLPVTLIRCRQVPINRRPSLKHCPTVLPLPRMATSSVYDILHEAEHCPHLALWTVVFVGEISSFCYDRNSLNLAVHSSLCYGTGGEWWVSLPAKTVNLLPKRTYLWSRHYV